MHVFHLPAAFHEFSREPVQQFRIAWRLSSQSEIIGRIHQSAPKKFLPHSIHGDARCQWVFPADEGIPENLEAAIDSASREPTSESAFDDVVRPDPSSWEKLPYAYFAIGETTGCSADHFQNHRLIFNLAFCGAVSGNRFLSDCPELSRKFLVMDKQGNPDPVATCNAYIASNPTELKEAYWKVRGVYVYQRE